MVDEFPESFDPSRCVLFLGAGFSADAKNRSNRVAYQNPPVGSGLNYAMKELAGLPKEDPSDYPDIAGHVISERLDLFGLLEELYTIREITPHQKTVLDLPWWRIYTTNYDNSVAVHRAAAGAKGGAHVFDITDAAPRQLLPNSIVHLHGSIAKCDPNNLDQTLILSRKSYIEQRVKKSEWWDWFERDIVSAQFVFFLGYDINDFEPASYLSKHNDLKSKCHFVLRTPKSPVAVSKVSNFGYRHSFELIGFVERLSRASTAKRPSHENELTTFKYTEPLKDNKLPDAPTSAEIQELLAFGRFRFRAAIATLPKPDYIVPRRSSVSKAKNLLAESTTIIVHGRIGNGKSIFVESLKASLSQSGYHCFSLKGGVPPLPEDIAFIAGMKRVVIFFPSYDSAVAHFHLFDGMPEGANYIVEMATSTLQVRMKEVQKHLRGKVGRLQVDRLDQGDVDDLRSLLIKGGLSRLSKSLELRPGIELRDFIIASYEDPEIAKRLRRSIEPLIEKPAAKRVIVTCAIIKAAGLPVDPAFIEDATGDDPFSTLNSLGEEVLELMEFSLDKIEPHSSILSEHLLKRYIEVNDFIGAVFSIASEAARRIDSTTDESSERFRKARTILSSTLKFSFLESIVGRNSASRRLIGRLYETCRRDSTIQKEPLFWLQYSIFWQDAPRWDLAESHMIEAYSRAEDRPSFKTYQLDTNYLGLLCDLEFHTIQGSKVSRFSNLLGSIDTCREMVDDGNHRWHVVKSFSKVERMVLKRAGDLSKTEAAALTYSLHLVVDKLTALKPEERAIFGTDACKDSLERAIMALTSHDYSGAAH